MLTHYSVVESNTATTVGPNWRVILDEQGHSLRWLAEATGITVRAVYSYSAWRPGMSRDDHGRRPKDAWLAKVSQVLGEDVTR